MSTPTENWPKPWMLERHALAVKHGFIWIEPISEADAKSLRDRLYRIRRRSDKSMAAFIPPEYHLVMVGKWEPGPDGTGRMPLIFNKRPDGKELPGTRIPDGAEVSEYLSPPPLAEPLVIDPAAIDVTLDEKEVGDIVARLRESARKRSGE